jgi:paraquat-inducible protein B
VNFQDPRATQTPGQPQERKSALPGAELKKHGRFSPLWFIPIVAAGLVIYLTVRAIAKHGPTVTLTFKTAGGLVAQQTQVRYKDLTLGTVDDVELADDASHVIVKVKMDSDARPLLTDKARFWVVRPRFGSLSALAAGLETLVSGAYIQIDPGETRGKTKHEFTGLEEPPAVRSDQKGRVFALTASRLGSLSVGAPVFFRDINVGEMLSYDIGQGEGPVAVRIFVQEPYDKFVHPTTRFWNASGISVGMGAGGLHVELESLQAVISGGIAFATTPDGLGGPPLNENEVFDLYDDKASADAAQYIQNFHYVTYFETSIEGLERGSSVQVFGVQVGTVRDVGLEYERGSSQLRARVTFDIQPKRVTPDRSDDDITPDAMRALVAKGLRVELVSASLLTGQKVLSLQYVPAAKKAEVAMEGDRMFVPSQAGGLDNIMASVSDIAGKLDKIPLDEIGDHLNGAMAGLDRTMNGSDLKNSLSDLSGTLAEAKKVVKEADQGMTPMLRRLPAIAEQMQQAVERANAAVGAGGYGQNSDMQHGVERLLGELTDTARSIRLLADFLDRHPESLIRGRSQGTEQ